MIDDIRDNVKKVKIEIIEWDGDVFSYALVIRYKDRQIIIVCGNNDTINIPEIIIAAVKLSYSNNWIKNVDQSGDEIINTRYGRKYRLLTGEVLGRNIEFTSLVGHLAYIEYGYIY